MSIQQNTNRIRTTHIGSLPRPHALLDLTENSALAWAPSSSIPPNTNRSIASSRTPEYATEYKPDCWKRLPVPDLNISRGFIGLIFPSGLALVAGAPTGSTLHAAPPPPR
jgi:hypothetical protein